MSDTPEAPTPEDDGAVTPTPETSATPETPAAAETTTPAADAQAEPAAATAPTEKKSRTGLFIGIGVGALVLLIGAIVAVVLLVLPLFGGGVGAAANPVRDYAAEPEKDWKYEFAGDFDDDYLDETPGYASIGTDKALIWPKFNSSAWQEDQSGSYGWYEGYDADYDLAYDNGAAYNAAREAWLEDYSKPYPSFGEYYLDEWSEAENYRGFYDGFYDGSDGEEKGANRVPAPEEPDFSPVVNLVNLNDGKSLWSLDLAEAADATYESYYSARDIEDTSYIAISVSSVDGSQLLTIDRNSGEVKSSFESDGYLSYTTIGGDVILLDTDEERDGTVSRVSPADLDGDATWENKVKDASFVGAIGDDYVRVSGMDDGEVFLAVDGEDANWGDDIGDEGVNYALAGTQLLRIERDDDEYEIEGWSFEGESTWEDSISTEWYYAGDTVLLIGEAASDGYEDIQRINLADGQEMWEDEFGDTIVGVGGVLGDRLFVANPKDRLLSLNLANGEEIYSTKVGEFGGSWFGTSKLYVVSDDELMAFNGNDKKELWSFELDDDESITQMGDRFVLVDTKKREIHGLK